jgi:D-threo-aldose 1-dehydrogenase
VLAAAAGLAILFEGRRRRRLQTGESYELLYIGCYTRGAPKLPYYSGHSEGAYIVSINTATGHLSVEDGPCRFLGDNPGYGSFNAARSILYVTNELPANAFITACALTKHGKLEKLGEPIAIADGGHPCFTAVADGGEQVFSAHYASGHVVSYPVATDGTLSAGLRSALPEGLHPLPGPGGPDGQTSERQQAAHAHCYVPLPGGRGIGLCCDLGSDTLFALRSADGTSVGRAAMPRGSGPRHVAVSADGRWAYVSTELSNQVVECPVDPYASMDVLGKPTAAISILPPAYSGPPTTASHIELSACGSFAFVGNRVGVPLHGGCAECTDGLISVIRIRGSVPSRGPHATGGRQPSHLGLVQTVSTGGKVPRSFTLVPSARSGPGGEGGWLVVGLQESGLLRSFKIDGQTGCLTPVHELPLPSPGCLVHLPKRVAAAAPHSARLRSLPRRRLGRTGLEVTCLALGGVGLGGEGDDDLYGGITDEAAIATVHRAIARGINFIDTSPLYRESERRIGLALEALPVEARKGLIVCSKVGDDCPPYSDNGGFSPFSYAGVKASVCHTLRMLRVVDRLDVVLLHDPTLAELDEFLAPGGGLQALKDLQRENVVGHIGLGCVEHEQHLRFLSDCSDASVLLTVNDFNLLRRFALQSSWPAAAKHDVGVLNAGAFYMGLLADPRGSWSQGFKKTLRQPELVSLAREMGEWSEAHGVPLRTLALQFAARHPSVSSVPIGCRSAKEVDEVVDSVLQAVPESLWSEFDETFGARVKALGREAHWYYDKSASKI